MDGGIDYLCPEAPDELVAVDGGYWMSNARALRLSCLMVATEHHRDLLLQQPPPPPAAPGASSAPIAIGLALLAGYVLGKWVLK